MHGRVYRPFNVLKSRMLSMIMCDVVQDLRLLFQHYCCGSNSNIVHSAPFEYDRAGTVLALTRQYSRSHVRMAVYVERVSMYWKAHKF